MKTNVRNRLVETNMADSIRDYDQLIDEIVFYLQCTEDSKQMWHELRYVIMQIVMRLLIGMNTTP